MNSAATAEIMNIRVELATTDEIIAQARAGRMFILVDDENRENEGDLIIPAAKITPAAVNFMATHGRGLICLAMEGEQIDRLALPPMVQNNQSKYNTAFTVSIGAREGIGTGISAYDRAQTIKVAADPASGPNDIVSPGHVFPLRAARGGVRERAGHTEAAVEIARLAGFSGAAALCEVMKDDGTMARLPDLLRFAAVHKMKVGTIADLINFLPRMDTNKHK
jgi:3,4-dihydroxy 2-butanone 4-phosphate synthase/GTP cyclohydrolase II